MNSRVLSVVFLSFSCVVGGLVARAGLVFDPVENRSANRELVRQEANDNLAQTGPAVQQNQIVDQSAGITSSAPASAVVATPVAPAPLAAAPSIQQSTVQTQVPSVQLQVNQVSTEPVTQADHLRRKRIQEEVRNEDKIQTRVEELRLRDESKRTQKILETVPVEEPVVAATVQQTQTVSVATTPSTSQATPQASSAPSTVTTAPGYYDNLPTAQSSPHYEGEHPVAAGALLQHAAQDHTVFSLTPKITVSNFTSTEPYNIDAQAGFGVDAGLGLTRYFSLVFGYTYTKFRAGFSQQATPYYSGYGYQTGSNDAIKINSNMFELALKLQFFDHSSIVRPFILGGFGVGLNYINYNKTYASYWGPTGTGPDYKLMQYTGVLGGGLDIKLASSVFLSGSFKFYPVIASNENTDNYYYYNDPYMYGYDKQGVANAIKSSALMSGTLGLLITF